MRDTQVVIERIVSVSEEWQRLYLTPDPYLDALKPGQTLLARPVYEPHPDRWDPYLREHWWPVSVTTDGLVVERPARQQYAQGDLYSVIGLVGKPYLYKRMLRHVLLLAYDTAPTPLVMACEWLVANKVNVTFVLFGKARQYPIKLLPPETEVIMGDDNLKWANHVMTVGLDDQVFVVAGRDDELGRFKQVYDNLQELRADLSKAYAFGVFQTMQPCGVGACHACLLPTQGSEPFLACTDGPAVDLTLLKWGA